MRRKYTCPYTQRLLCTRCEALRHHALGLTGYDNDRRMSCCEKCFIDTFTEGKRLVYLITTEDSKPYLWCWREYWLRYSATRGRRVYTESPYWVDTGYIQPKPHASGCCPLE